MGFSGRGSFPAHLSECEVRAGLVGDVARARLRATAEGTVRLVCEPSLDKAAGWERPEMIAQLVGGLPRHCTFSGGEVSPHPSRSVGFVHVGRRNGGSTIARYRGV